MSEGKLKDTDQQPPIATGGLGAPPAGRELPHDLEGQLLWEDHGMPLGSPGQPSDVMLGPDHDHRLPRALVDPEARPVPVFTVTLRSLACFMQDWMLSAFRNFGFLGHANLLSIDDIC